MPIPAHRLSTSNSVGTKETNEFPQRRENTITFLDTLLRSTQSLSPYTTGSITPAFELRTCFAHTKQTEAKSEVRKLKLLLDIWLEMPCLYPAFYIGRCLFSPCNEISEK
jgi:hypothetical protein